jgi:heme-degrading monooxygenase HmoA
MRTLEVHMFARNVSFRLKSGRSAEFTQVFDKDVLPVLRKQKGFQDEIALVAPDGMDAIGVSLWDTKENAET